MLTIYFTRHGQTEWNVQRRLQGWGNGELTELGLSDAKKLAIRLQDTPLDIIYASTSKRAYQTAEIIATGRNIPIEKKDVFREICFGDWDGQYVDDITAQYPDDFHTFWKEPQLFNRETCETFSELQYRVKQALQFIVDQNSEGTVLVVAHSIFLRMLFATIKKMPISQVFTQKAPANTSLTKIIYDGTDFKIEYESDMSHTS